MQKDQHSTQHTVPAGPVLNLLSKLVLGVWFTAGFMTALLWISLLIQEYM